MLLLSRRIVHFWADPLEARSSNILRNDRQGFEDWQDPRSTGGTSGLAITADWLTRPLELKSDARYVVVVEKDGVFNRMVEDGFFDRQAIRLRF